MNRTLIALGLLALALLTVQGQETTRAGVNAHRIGAKDVHDGRPDSGRDVPASALALLLLDSPAVPAQPGEGGPGRPMPPHADRSRALQPKRSGARDSLNWRALALCESSGNPRAVSHGGRYRGAFQMTAGFWRTYGGLRFAARPDLATYAEQLVVAKHGYAARGRAPWPTCGSRL